MENFASNINKPDFHNYDDVSFMEEEYDFDFKSMDQTEEDTFEDSNIYLNSEEYTNNSNFFQLDINAFQSARYFSTITDNIDDYILELDSNFDDESVISMATDITNEIQLIEISEPTKSTKFTNCVLIDNFNGEIRSCGSSQNLR
ncbi:3308_t:CDS:1, partial [Rhizophagus irregularis]